MKLVKTKQEDIKELVKISKEAFNSDIYVGAVEPGGPPEYDNTDWHIQMMKEGHLLTAFHDNKIVGGIIVFPEEKSAFMYVGRIFVAPIHFRKGYGIAIMKEIERMYPDISTWMLDTPAWNVRTNSFYKKIGYSEKKRDAGEVVYQKNK